MNTIALPNTESLIAALGWFIVSVGAGLAVFARTIHDTVFETVGLSCVCIVAFGTSYRILRSSVPTEYSVWVAVGLAIYVISIMVKHWHKTKPKPECEESEKPTLY